MRKRFYFTCLLVGWLATSPVFAQGAFVSKFITLQEGASSAAEVPVTGTLLKGTAKVYWLVGGLGGGHRLRVDFAFTNTGQKKTQYAFNVAFLDKTGSLVACSNHYEVFAVEPGKSGSTSVETPLPEILIRKIAATQIMLYDGPGVMENQ